MSSLNMVQLIGHLGRDPEGRHTQSGQAVASFSIATEEQWKDKATGEKKKRSEWHRCEVWGKLAEIVLEYLKKGRQVYVCGQLRTEEWVDKEGIKRYTTKVIVSEMKMLGKANESVGGRPDPEDMPPQRQSAEIDDDTIPF